jgi:hypothetical protein
MDTSGNNKQLRSASDNSSEHPKTFISYCWTSNEHQEWVINLATQLVENGVDIILDVWNLHEGNDANAFMERMVTDPTVKKVLLICNSQYVNKANSRKGGVGTETQIITGEIYKKEDQEKFVALVLEHDDQDKALVPAYYSSRLFIDMSDNDEYAIKFEQLLRWIFDQPFHIKPELGKKPAFLSDSGGISLGTSTTAMRALDAIKNAKGYWLGALTDYFDTYSSNLNNFRIQNFDKNFDDQIVNNIDQFIPYRNEAIGIFHTLARYNKSPEAYEEVHSFFGKLIPYLQPSIEITSWSEWNFDNFRFIIHELFLYAVAIFLRNNWITSVSYLLSTQFLSIMCIKVMGFSLTLILINIWILLISVQKNLLRQLNPNGGQSEQTYLLKGRKHQEFPFRILCKPIFYFIYEMQ